MTGDALPCGQYEPGGHMSFSVVFDTATQVSPTKLTRNDVVWLSKGVATELPPPQK